VCVCVCVKRIQTSVCACHDEGCVFYYCRTYYKAVRVGGESGGHMCGGSRYVFLRDFDRGFSKLFPHHKKKSRDTS